MSLEFTEVRIMTQENYQEISPLGKDIDPYVSLVINFQKTETLQLNKDEMQKMWRSNNTTRKDKQAQQNNGDNG